MTRRKFIKIFLGTVYIIAGPIPSLNEKLQSDSHILGFDLVKNKDKFEVYYFDPADFGGPSNNGI